MTGLAWPILCMVVGLLLLIVEVFIPSGGLIGVLALGLIVVSLWLSFAQSAALGLKFSAALVLLAPMVIAVALHLWPRTPLAKKMFLRPPDPDFDDEFQTEHHRLDHLVGQIGRSLTPLRPSGMVDFEGKRIDAIAEEGLIEAGSLVEALRVHGGRLVVRPAAERRLDDLLE
jgi:membrane-bound ClpP family serine protease